MKYLSKLPQDVQELVVSLPFRVGLFVSESDQTGGDESAEAERKALENIVTFYVEDTVKGEFAHEVMIHTLNHKDKWAEWSQNIDKVPEECLHLTYKMKDMIESKEILAYKQNLVEIAIVIAQAYCEFGENSSAMTKLEVYASVFLKKMQGLFGGGNSSANQIDLNISADERAAIQLLARNLGIDISF